MSAAARQGKLQKKIFAWSFFPTAIILLAVALVNFQAYQQVTEDLVVQRNRELARLLAGRLSSDLDDLSRRFEELSAALSNHHGDLSTQQAYFHYARNNFPDFDGGLWVFSYATRDAIRVWPDGQPLDEDFFQSPLLRHIDLRRRSSSDTIISDLTTLVEGHEEYIALSTYYKGNNGIFIGLIRLASGPENSLYQFFKQKNLDERGAIYLVDGNGRVIYHSQPELIGQDYSDQEIIRQVLAGKVGSLRTHNQDNLDVVVSYAPVLGTRWGLVIQEEWSALAASSQGYMAFLLALLALGVLVPAGVVAFGVRRIVKPIQALTLAAQEVAGGRFSQQIQAKTGDEVEELAHQFNQMAQQLQASYAYLEQRVAARTRELATINAVASVVSQTLELQEVLHSALRATAEAMDIETGAVFIIPEDQKRLTLAAHQGLSAQFLDQIESLRMDAGSDGQFAIRHPGEYEERLARAMEQEGFQQLIQIPLVSKGKTLGLMVLCSRCEKPTAGEEVDTLVSIGKQVGVAVENARLYEQAEASAAAAERNRLARDLHDAVTQTLFSVSLIAEVLPRLWEINPEEGLNRLEEVRQLTKGALAEMRSLLIELRPAALLETDFRDLFRYLAYAFSGRELIPVDLHVEGDGDLEPDVKIAIYRIAQEALNNIAKHARATKVVIEVNCQPDGVKMIIQDDGCGFDMDDVPPDHFGLAIMKERAAAIGAGLVIQSEVGNGSRLTFTWNCASERA